MNRVIDYLTNPTTWIAFGVFLFGLGGIYTSLNMRLNAVEKQCAEYDILNMQTDIAQIKTDLQRIKYQLQK